MIPRYRHAPIVDSSRRRCAVCNHAVYSLAGIHPQCAVKLSDPRQASKKPSGQPAEAELPGEQPVVS
jgi:hypothetical protein